MYGWSALLYNRNLHSSVKQLYPNKKGHNKKLTNINLQINKPSKLRKKQTDPEMGPCDWIQGRDHSKH